MYEDFDLMLIAVTDRAIYEGAAELIQRFGSAADIEAAARAHASRAQGNFVHFCRWRQIERFIPILAGDDEAFGTIH